MKELLLQYNYTYDGHCHCDGFPTEKYKLGDYQLRIRTKKELFRIKYMGRTITQWIPIGKLEETLNNYHAAVQA